MHAASLPADSRPGLPERAIVGAIAGYRLAAGPVKLFLGLQGCCRYSPTCSHYWEEAVRLHGAGTGSLLGARRLLRCHPWGSEGYDPVPTL